MADYAGTGYSQSGFADQAELRYARERAERIRSWELRHATIAIKMGVLDRGGGTEALHKEIIGLAREYVAELESLVASSPMPAAKRLNRYT